MQNPDISAGEKKQFENESTWSNECINVCPDAANKSSDSPDDVEPQDKESVFICEVKCSALGDDQDGRREKTLSRLRQRLAKLNAVKVVNQNEKIAEAWNIENNPIDPTPENKEAWLEHAFPKDENGNSIRPQIDTTIPSEKQFVEDLKSGKVCPLAAQAFQTQTKFDPAP